MKKYVDEVIFICHKNGNKSEDKHKQLCVVWSYSGKVYFGECQYHSGQDDQVIRVVKDGLGMEWLPSSKFELI